jgi:hypothetical protein
MVGKVCEHYLIGWAAITMTVSLDSPTTTVVHEPKNDTPRAEAKAAPKRKAAAKQTAKDPKLAEAAKDAAKAEKQAKEIVALAARVLDTVRNVTTDPNISGKGWASPMITSIKQRTGDLQQRIKDNPQMARAVLHAAMFILHSSHAVVMCAATS